MVKFKNVCKTKSIEIQKSTLNPYVLYSILSCRIHKQHTHNFLKKDEIQNLGVLPNLWRSASHVSMPPTKSTKRVWNVHELNINKTQLLFMSHNHVQHKHPFCIMKYTYCHWVFYTFFSHFEPCGTKLCSTWHTPSTFTSPHYLT